MLDPWIIEEILRREEDERRKQERRIEMPLESPSRYHDITPSTSNPQPAEGDRGVVVIDI
jgi:hypothetical protein